MKFLELPNLNDYLLKYIYLLVFKRHLYLTKHIFLYLLKKEKQTYFQDFCYESEIKQYVAFFATQRVIYKIERIFYFPLIVF